ncbi:mannosyltransferase family protein [Acidithiobacillus sp. M4-SHS-6]|uniref:mannosyltransferase family protein n=1 Tax=Acidithiobacillus sp. M4-SHS-6 TaxID=3383024 RepID=UPI0039BDE1A4
MSRPSLSATKADHSLRWPLLAIALSALAIYAGTWVGYYWFSRGLDPVAGSVAQALINWDAKWYMDIATQGYHYIPHADFGQNIIFFPLCPAICAGLDLILPIPMPAIGIGLAIFFGIVSIFLFQHLARAWLDAESAAFTTLTYALYPAAAFFISAYPTSLMNCLAIATLLALHQQRHFQAALWVGIGTASGPLMVFFAFGTWLVLLWHIWVIRQNPAWIRILKSVGLGIISCSGLMLFMAYQWYLFKTPWAFVVAHGPYIGHLSPLQKLQNILELYPFWGGNYTPLIQALLLEPTTLNPARSVYFLMNALVLLGNLIALGVLWRRRQWTLLIISIPVIFAYLWFQGAAQGPVSTYRLLYINLPLFLAAGWLFQSAAQSVWPRLLLMTETTALILQAAFFISGHWAF